MTKIDSDHSVQNWWRYRVHETFIFFQNEKSHALNYANSCNKLGVSSTQQQPYRQCTLKTVSVQLQAWQAQLPALYVAYVQHKYNITPPEVPKDPTFFHIAVLGIEGMHMTWWWSNRLTPSQGYDSARAVPQDEQDSYINETLLHHGLLGTSPVKPMLAIPLNSLELYHQCHLQCPQFSIQQWVKVLCDLANVSCISCSILQLLIPH